jgi:hypothetical protein
MGSQRIGTPCGVPPWRVVLASPPPSHLLSLETKTFDSSARAENANSQHLELQHGR